MEVIKSLGKNLLTGAHRTANAAPATATPPATPPRCGVSRRFAAPPLHQPACPGPHPHPLPAPLLPPAGNLDLLKVSLPVKMFEPRSYLQKLADPWVYPRFLRLAAECHDPLERLQWVVTYFIAGGWRDGCLPVPV